MKTEQNSRPFNDQIRTVATRLFPNRLIPSLVTVSEVTGQIVGDDAAEAARIARSESLSWLGHPKRSGRLPAAAMRHEDFDVNEPGNQVAAIRLVKADLDYWVVRFDHMDPNAAARSWSTEVTVAVVDGVATFGTRLLLSSQEEYPQFTASVPGVVRHVAVRPGLSIHGNRVAVDLKMVNSNETVEQLVDRLRDSTRSVPVYVVSLPPEQDDPRFAIVNPEMLARRCIGVAEVAAITAEASFQLTREIGKEFSVFHQAVRTYQPRFDPSEDSPYHHALYLPHRISSWNDTGPTEFLEYLVRSACRPGQRQWSEAERALPRYNTVKGWAITWRREQAASKGDIAAEGVALRAEIDTLRADADTAVDLAQQEERRRQDAERQLAELQDENRRLRWTVNELRGRVENRQTAQIPAHTVRYPGTLAEIRKWSDENLAGRIIMTPRAVRAAKDSPFQEPELVYKALAMLANEYWRMRVEGGPRHQETFDRALRDLHLENTRSGDPSRLHECGDSYIVEHGGRRHLLDWHIKKGNAREAARCLRIYYTWDDDTQQVIVGSLPGHLESRES